jgi:hypothetical protein
MIRSWTYGLLFLGAGVFCSEQSVNNLNRILGDILPAIVSTSASGNTRDDLDKALETLTGIVGTSFQITSSQRSSSDEGVTEDGLPTKLLDASKGVLDIVESDPVFVSLIQQWRTVVDSLQKLIIEEEGRDHERMDVEEERTTTPEGDYMGDYEPDNNKIDSVKPRFLGPIVPRTRAATHVSDEGTATVSQTESTRIA